MRMCVSVSSSFSTERSLVSVSIVPRCGEQKRQTVMCPGGKT